MCSCRKEGCANCTACPIGHTSSDNRTSCEPCSIGESIHILFVMKVTYLAICYIPREGSHAPVDGSRCLTCTPGLICKWAILLLVNNISFSPSILHACSQTGCIECRSCPGGYQPMGMHSVISCEQCPPGKCTTSSITTVYYPSIASHYYLLIIDGGVQFVLAHYSLLQHFCTIAWNHSVVTSKAYFFTSTFSTNRMTV